MSDKLQQLQKRPVQEWYKKMVEGAGDVVSAPVGGQLVSNALNRRHVANELRERLRDLPRAVLSYDPEQMAAYGGLVPEMRQVGILAASLGLSREDIAKLLGVTAKRLHNWVEKGMEGIEPYKSFAEALLQTEVLTDLDDENDAREAVALELKTSSSYLTLLKRKDEKRQLEKEYFADLPLEEFTDEELEEYETSGKVPARFRNKSRNVEEVDTEMMEENYPFMLIYRKDQQIKMLEQKVAELQRKVVFLEGQLNAY